MIIIGIIFCVIVAIIIILLVMSGKSEEVVEKEKFAIPPQRRYPCIFFKDCHFFVDEVSRFAYSDDEIEQFVGSLEDAFDKEDYVKAFKLSGEIIKILPKADRVWIRRISSIIKDTINNEKCWDFSLSKLVINACFGFIQCYDNVIDKSKAVKHILLPIVLKEIDDLIKYQNNNVTKYHNLEVYNMLLNLYYITPYRDILVILSNYLLEDKVDKDFGEDSYVKSTLNSILKQVDTLRTQNTSRLQESFDAKKITNCALITDDKLEATIVAFELNFDKGSKRERIEAIFFDENGNEIHFGNNFEDRYIDTLVAESDRGFTSKEEIVLLTDTVVNKVRLSICKGKKEVISQDEEENDINEKEDAVEDEESKSTEDTDNQSKDNKPQMLMYPSFDNIKSIDISDTQFVGLKANKTVVNLGFGNKLKQETNTWKNIEKIYVKNDAIYGIREDGTVIYAGESEYEGIEYIYSWENVESLSLGDKHITGITKNATVYAVGDNTYGQCNVDDWYDVIQVATSYHTVGLCKNGSVVATGENNFGECDVKAWKDIVQIAVGDFYTLGLTSSGKVLAAGLNSCGQCNVEEWANIKKIFANGNMSVGLRYDGKIVTTGKNSYHYGDIKNWSRISNIVMSHNRIAGIEQDSTVKVTGKPYRNFVNDDWENVKSVAMSSDNIVALKEDGTLISNDLIFGNTISNNFDGITQICDDLGINKIAMVSDKGVLTINDKIKNVENGDGIYPTFYDIKLVDMSKTHIVMLKTDGTVSSMRFIDNLVEVIDGWENIIDVEAGDGFFIGLDISGNVVATGENDHNECEVSEWHEIVKIRAAGKRAMGLSIDGKLYMSGVSEFGEDDFIKISKNIKDFALTEQQTMILEADGTVKVTYHPNGVDIESIKEWKNIKKVVARGNNFLCLTEDGKVYSTILNEAEISSWEDIDDIDASGNYVWASLKT